MTMKAPTTTLSTKLTMASIFPNVVILHSPLSELPVRPRLAFPLRAGSDYGYRAIFLPDRLSPQDKRGGTMPWKSRAVKRSLWPPGDARGLQFLESGL